MPVTWKVFHKKTWLTTQIERELGVFTYNLHCNYPQNEFNSNVLEKPNNNNRKPIVGPSSSGKTHLMLKIFSRIFDRDINIITEITS